MATSLLSHNHIFGLKPSVKDAVWFMDESRVIYPAGHNVIIYDTENKSQKFIHGSDNTLGISAICVSPCKRFLAVAEQAERGIVVVYDLKTLKKKKVLSTPESLSQQVNP
jgi:hypothetical protein